MILSENTKLQIVFNIGKLQTFGDQKCLYFSVIWKDDTFKMLNYNCSIQSTAEIGSFMSVKAPFSPKVIWNTPQLTDNANPAHLPRM